jgi:hypothetical protein
VYWGPHLLFNATLLWSGQGESDRHGLVGEPFLLSPLYCGSRSLGYARTENSRPDYSATANLPLGRVMAISGGAGQPRCGPALPRALTALLTLFCARPGAWIERPQPAGWSAASPLLGDLPIAASAGLANAGGDFVYLAGGGQSDGLGVYELIRRRCRYIVAVAAGKVDDDGLANLISRCRVDFGLRIEIDTRPLQQRGPDGYSRSHFAIGAIHYGDVDAGATSGTFIYVKILRTGDEPPDVALRAFGDEWFERDRALGEHIARAVFGAAVGQPGERRDLPAGDSHTEYIPRLFTAVSAQWAKSLEAGSELRPTLERGQI